MTAFGCKLPVQKFHRSKFTLDYDSQMTDTRFVQYTLISSSTLQRYTTPTPGIGKKSVADRTRIKDTVGQTHHVQDTTAVREYTDADDADIRPIFDEEPMAEVQLTAECNIFAIGQTA
ncbi:hypothetical protein Tco_0655164 [Tanacetum coccineum]|uniref:Uncharacterized protein n=1 Tax=Tanacetum coccineum TaxID=301880 RepID=A0ABQ4X5W6_9ASTR